MDLKTCGWIKNYYKQANFNTWVKIKFLHPCVRTNEYRNNCFHRLCSNVSSRILTCRIGQLLYDEAILEKGSLKSFICFSYHLMFYFFVKRVIYCPWSPKLYLQTIISQIKAVATQMDIPWHTMAYSNLSSANPALYWIHGGLFKI